MSSRASILALILGALGGAIVVLSIQSSLSSGPDHDSAAAEPGARSTDPELAAALREVATELRALREERERASQRVAPSERIEVPDSNSTTSPDLAAAMRELAEALRSRSASTQAGPTLVVPRPDAPHAWIPEATGSVDEFRHQVTREHLFWSEQQMLDRYGAPTEILPDDGGVIRWVYAAEDKPQFLVRFQAGRVISIWP